MNSGPLSTRIARAGIGTAAIEGFTIDGLIINLVCQQPFGLQEVLRHRVCEGIIVCVGSGAKKKAQTQAA